MQALIEASRPYRAHEEPPNVTAAAEWTPPGLRLGVARHLPANILGELRIWQRTLWLSDRLFPAPSQLVTLERTLLGGPAARAGWDWEWLIEGNISARLVLASLFTAWYSYAPLVASAIGRCAPEEVADGTYLRDRRRFDPVWGQLFTPYRSLVVAFAPVRAMCKAFNTGWQSRYYSEFWRRLLSLLVNQRQLDAQTRSYLCLEDDERLPRGRELDRALCAASRQMTPRERAYYADPQGEWRFVWEQYLEFLAGESRTPRVLPFSKLTGAYREIKDGRALSELTSELIAHDKRLCDLRHTVATDAQGYGLPSDADVGLYLAEPKRLIPDMGKGGGYWNGAPGGVAH